MSGGQERKTKEKFKIVSLAEKAVTDYALELVRSISLDELCSTMDFICLLVSIDLEQISAGKSRNR